ncbi:DNA replication/repair protein RecF [Paenibacillus contaminans]|uniref:DNA replication and repair protein RecF n=1 Tax=Paenibacillus contaminans TaxID=450362 RepID=A0A329MIA5_9BACL|nr:DNA replication/repair protein RecF [Paenibacillus contaminans]RAV19534.1 DNA replication/repair protein RecF [Paenibacillus contaminans]
MFLKSIGLSGYRNYADFELRTDSSVNIFIGPNAQGKTNLLEAIYVLALTKSHRTHQDKELIGWDKQQALLYGELDKKYGPIKLQLSISQNGKKAKLNGLEQKKLSGYVGAMNVVMFAPEDLEIVKGSPGIRRRFLDMEIGQVQPSYLYDITQYQKILLQRNNFLKTPAAANSSGSAMLDVWNEQIAGYGVKIIKKRQSFIEKLQQWAERIHSGITNGQEQLLIRYAPSLECPPEEAEAVLLDQFMLKLSKVKEQEVRRGTTLVGPHRDDLLFYINDKEVQTFGSQGQQRTTALSLKLAELELIREEVGEYPILLLDDVLSELDRYRQTQLIETFQDKVQTFITTTGIESVNLDKISGAAIFQVRSGTVVAE